MGESRLGSGQAAQGPAPPLSLFLAQTPDLDFISTCRQLEEAQVGDGEAARDFTLSSRECATLLDSCPLREYQLLLLAAPTCKCKINSPNTHFQHFIPSNQSTPCKNPKCRMWSIWKAVAGPECPVWPSAEVAP